MNKQKATSRINGKAAEVQSFVRGQLEEAQKRFVALEEEAERVLKNLVARGRESRKELDGLLAQIDPAEWLQAATLKDIGKRAGEAGTEVRRRLDHLQARVIEAVGVASQSQVQEITKELSRISKKIDGLVGKKTARPTPRALVLIKTFK